MILGKMKLTVSLFIIFLINKTLGCFLVETKDEAYCSYGVMRQQLLSEDCVVFKSFIYFTSVFETGVSI